MIGIRTHKFLFTYPDYDILLCYIFIRIKGQIVNLFLRVRSSFLSYNNTVRLSKTNTSEFKNGFSQF